jgi:hypothetical protein
MILCVCGRYEICDKVIFLCHFNNVIHSLFQIFIKELVKFYAITSMARRTLKFIHSITISTTISTKMGCWVAELLGWKTPDLPFSIWRNFTQRRTIIYSIKELILPWIM